MDGLTHDITVHRASDAAPFLSLRVRHGSHVGRPLGGVGSAGYGKNIGGVFVDRREGSCTGQERGIEATWRRNWAFPMIAVGDFRD